MVKNVWAIDDELGGLDALGDGAVADGLDVVFLKEPHETVLNVVGVQLNL